MAVHDVGAEQVVADPAAAVPLVPAERTGALADPEHDLGPAARHQLSRGGPRGGQGVVDHVGDEAAVARALEPAAAADQVDPAVAVDVGGRQALEAPGRGLEDGRQRPGAARARVGGDRRQQQPLGVLVPERELRPAVAVEVGEDLIVVLVGAAVLDHVAPPARRPIVARSRVLPPPDVVARSILAHDEVEIAVLIDVVGGAAGLDRQEVRLDDLALPAGRLAPVPDQRWCPAAGADHEILDAVAIEVGDQGRGLLVGGAGRRQIAGGARKMQPGRVDDRPGTRGRVDHPHAGLGRADPEREHRAGHGGDNPGTLESSHHPTKIGAGAAAGNRAGRDQTTARRGRALDGPIPGPLLA